MTINAHPELPEFDYIRPASLGEASRFLVEHAGEARPLLGGTDIFVRMRDGFWHDKYLVDLKHLPETTQMYFDANNASRGLTIGAAVSMNRVMYNPDVKRHYSLLAEAIRSVASYQLRSRATIVGNICNASPAGDTIGACLCLSGVLTVYGLNGSREVPLEGFFTGPGSTVLQPGDIVTAIHFPLPPMGAAGHYLKLGRNTWSDLSIVGVAAYGFPTDNTSSGYRFRLSLASVFPIPLVPVEAEAYLAEHTPGPEIFDEAARLASAAAKPIDDVRSSARYRKAMVRKLTRKAIQTTWEQMGR